MKTKFLSFVILLLFTLDATCINLNNASTPAATDSVVIKKCMDFSVTGKGIDDAWNLTDWVPLTPGVKKDSAYLTRVKVLYSGTGIYFLYNCEDRKLVSTMKADNLDLWEEDVVEAFLWTDEKFPVYFEYELSPYNFELPIMVPNNNGTFLGWLPWHYEGDRKTQHATSIIPGKDENEGTIAGWIAEFFIPFKLLTPLGNVPPVSGTRWRANMYRIDYDRGIIPYAWQRTQKTFHEFRKFGVFIFQ